MEAPDKICVAPHQIDDYDLDIQEVGHNGAVEYIRKEALLEWAKEQKKDEMANFPYVLDMLIDKLNSM